MPIIIPPHLIAQRPEHAIPIPHRLARIQPHTLQRGIEHSFGRLWVGRVEDALSLTAGFYAGEEEGESSRRKSVSSRDRKNRFELQDPLHNSYSRRAPPPPLTLDPLLPVPIVVPASFEEPRFPPPPPPFRPDFGRSTMPLLIQRFPAVCSDPLIVTWLGDRVEDD